MSKSLRHDLTVQMVKVEDLVPWERNPRQNDAAAERLAYTIQEQGWTTPILVQRESGRIIGGHTRLKAAIKIGLTEVPVIHLDVEDRQADAIAIADNRLGEIAQWDNDELARLLEEIEADGGDLLAIGYNDADWSELLDSLDAEESFDDLPEDVEPEEPPEDPVSRLGEVYELGPHRLVCGDSTDGAVVALLMGGEMADAVVTDPPYGQNQPGVPGDSPDDLDRILNGCLSVMPVSDAVIVAFSSPRTFPTWLDASRAVGHKFERMLWLYKEAQLANPWRGWILKSEAILVTSFGKGSWQEVHPYAHDTYKLASVNSKNSGFDGDLGWHGSVKPLSVVEDIVARVTPKGGILFEPFCGSGTTLIAGAKCGARVRAIERDEGYCDVIRRRWTKWAREAGQDPGPGALD